MRTQNKAKWEIALEQKRYQDSQDRARLDDLTHADAFKAFGESSQPQAQHSPHSPLPWRVDFNKYDQQYRVYSGELPVINSMFHGDKAEDAKLIVSSVNNVQALAEALRIVSRWLPSSPAAHDQKRICEVVRDALGNWEGAQ